MNNLSAVRLLFWVGAAYDGILGAAFLVAWSRIFAAFGVTPPNHPGYVQFPAALLIVFALLFAAVARRPRENRNLIPYGALLKVAYCSVVFGHALAEGIPFMWIPFAWADLVFLVLFVLAYRHLARVASSASTARRP